MSVRIHELTEKTQPVPTNDDLLLIEVKDGVNYQSKKITVASLLTSHRDLIGYFNTLSGFRTNVLVASSLTIQGGLSANLSTFFVADTLDLSINKLITKQLAELSSATVKAGDGYFTNLYLLSTLVVSGTVTTLDALVTTTSSLSVSNVGNSAAVTIRQLGNNALIDAYSNNNRALYLDGRTGNLFLSGQLSVSGNSSFVNDLSVGGKKVAVETKIANSLYVSTSGSDSNDGTSPDRPFATIKRACQIAHNARVANGTSARFTIFVGTGDYYEHNPVYVPPNASLIGDNLRRTNIYPRYPQSDILWVDNSTYVWGFTFRGHLEPAAAIAFPNLSPSLSAMGLSALSVPSPKWNKPYILTSPYIQGCSSITSGTNGVSAGAGMRVDGSLTEGFLRSMVLDSYTQFNETGKGIHITNNGYAQLVSIFTICCTHGIHCDNGGTCSINTSNCSFGLSGLVAEGHSTLPVLSGSLYTNPSGSSLVTVQNVDGLRVYSSPDNNTSFYTNILGWNGVIVKYPYDGLLMKIGTNPTLHTIIGTPVLNNNNRWEITVKEPFLNSFALGPNTKVEFYLRSTITASAHTFEYIGTGTSIGKALPALGGVTVPENEATSSGGGMTYFTSTNQSGNFRVGNDFTIVQETGTIEGDTFKRSILTLITPLTLALE
jgi:hypothetical protein